MFSAKKASNANSPGGRMTICPMAISNISNRQFASWTIRRSTKCSSRQLNIPSITSPRGKFSPWTIHHIESFPWIIHPIENIPHGKFIPRKIPHGQLIPEIIHLRENFSRDY